MLVVDARQLALNADTRGPGEQIVTGRPLDLRRRRRAAAAAAATATAEAQGETGGELTCPWNLRVPFDGAPIVNSSGVAEKYLSCFYWSTTTLMKVRARACM